MTELATSARPVPSRRDGTPLPPVDPVLSLPILTLLPFSRCGCRCAMCDIWRERNGSALSRHDVESLLPDLGTLRTRRIVLSGGEPLMHPDLFDLVAPLVGAGLGLTLLTSGLLLERFARSIGEAFDDVVVSLDGPPAVHDLIRGVPGAFAALARGTAALRRLPRVPSLSGRCTVQRTNVSSLRQTVRAAHDLGLDRISFLPVDTASAAFGRAAGADAGGRLQVLPEAPDLAALEDELCRLEAANADDLASGFVAESASKLRRRLLAHFRALRGEEPFPPASCNAPWVSAVVETDLSVRPCFFHPAYGRIGDGGLEAVLNGRPARAFRRSLDVATDPVCLRCPCRLNLREAGGEAA